MVKSPLHEETFTILDGAVGTMLQPYLAPGVRTESAVFTHPAEVVSLHRAYLDAGSDIVCAVTFGANRLKLAGSGIQLEETIHRAMDCAHGARAGGRGKIALDVGPLGELLEPGGTLSFEEAYDCFAQVVQLGAEAGADLIILATMTDLYEAKAALLAAVENTSLPVMVSMTFEPNGRTFTGVPVEAMAATLEGLGAAALGINCSLGPDEIVPLARRLCGATTLPVFIKPNAGLPDPLSGQYTVGPEAFCTAMQPLREMGVAAVGGCCGTTPETIRLLAQLFAGKEMTPRNIVPVSRVCSNTRVLHINGVHPIGERINPTGKKRLQQALLTGDVGYVQTLAVEQQQSGAAILDVNVGAPGVDEVALLPQVVKAVQAVSPLPLQLDSANPEALAAALRVYNGKAIVNSTSGEAEKLKTVLPLCKRYGAAAVGLTLDEDGIPSTAEGRLAVAQKILDAALAVGIPKEDVYIDTLTLTAGAAPDAPQQTTKALQLVKTQLGLKTLLGVSNVSFGLPNRLLLNQTFLAMALQAGLDLPILNPSAVGMMDTVRAFRLLTNQDKEGREFIKAYGEEGKTKTPQPVSSSAMPLDTAIEKGLKTEAAASAKELLTRHDGLSIVNAHLIPALDRVGKGFEAGTIFLPQLLAAAGAAQAAFEEIRATYDAAEAEGPPVVVATVQGDVHDIGKNIAKVLLENYGFHVIDLGRDVPPERVVEAAVGSGAKLVGLSALMTTTLPNMAATIQALRRAKVPCEVMVGGAVLTEDYAKTIGADHYVKDAQRSVEVARQIYNRE